MKRIDKIAQWFLSDTVELLDLKLDDADTDPQYSAVTVLERLALYLEYSREFTVTDEDVFEYLSESGYCKADVEKFKSQYFDELRRRSY